MAEEKANGHSAGTERMIEVLERIEKRLDEGFRSVNARLDETNARLDQTNSRLDNLIALSGSSHRELEARVTKIEATLARPARRAARPSG